MWGYKPIPNATTPDQEKPTLDAWAREQDAKPYRVSRQQMPVGQTGKTPKRLVMQMQWSQRALASRT
jgi:hypothetical protein